MSTTEKISQQVHQLPESFQKEVLDFIEFLVNKTKRESSREEDLAWFDFSLTSAMREIENENGPNYDESDLKEKFLTI